ncbi:MAG: class I SAM-dependent methyltransferase [Anaerolineales bacterium]|nr:MAG: class I SAM-dependent methyltransferase [Anaerolineales bacterium]
MSAGNVRCYLCGSTQLELIVDIRQKPARETDFGIAPDAYDRQVYQCSRCTVYVNVQDMLGTDIYGREYNQATYSLKLLDTFNRIRSLPEAQSDNKQRVRRVMELNARNGRSPQDTHVLDIGSGLCVFLAELKDHGFYCYAIDPDPLSAQHALAHAGVDGAHAGTLDTFLSDQKFDLIALNKVLEHVPDPVRMLKQAKSFLSPGGFVYIELPDGDGALRNGDAVGREEFYIEHFTIFTPDSMSKLASLSGFVVREMKQIHEPSDKYSIYSFLSL